MVKQDRINDFTATGFKPALLPQEAICPLVAPLQRPVTLGIQLTINKLNLSHQFTLSFADTYFKFTVNLDRPNFGKKFLCFDIAKTSI